MENNPSLNKNNMTNTINIILAAFICVLFGMFAYINLVQYKLGLNADVAAEGLLARVMWESKEWLPKEWYWGNELRVISTPNIAALFYGISKSICVSMGLSCIVASAYIVGGAYCLCKSMDFTVTQKLLFVFLIMLLPNNETHIELMYVYASYYAFHIGTYFLSMAVYIKLLKKQRVRNVFLAIIALFHFVLGVQGVRGLLMISGPLMAVEVVRRTYLWWKEKTWRSDNNTITAYVVLLNIVEYVGGKFPKSVGYPLSRNIRKAPQKLLEIVWPDFLHTFGWKTISLLEKIMFILLLCVMLYLMISLVIKGIQKHNITEEEWIFTNFFVSTILTMTALTFTTVESSSRYFVTVYFAITTMIVLLVGKKKVVANWGIVCVVIMLLVGNFSRMYYPMVTDKSYENHIYVQIGEYLVEEGYERAYSSFDISNTSTVFNDGKIQVSPLNSFSEMDVCKCLASRKWYVPNVSKESKTAYIVSDYKLAEIEEFLREHPGDIEFKTKIGIFNIFGSEYNYSKLVD